MGAGTPGKGEGCQALICNCVDIGATPGAPADPKCYGGAACSSLVGTSSEGSLGVELSTCSHCETGEKSDY